MKNANNAKRIKIEVYNVGNSTFCKRSSSLFWFGSSSIGVLLFEK